MTQPPSRDQPARLDDDKFVPLDSEEDDYDEETLLSSSEEHNLGPSRSTALPSRRAFWTTLMLIWLLSGSCSLNIYLGLKHQQPLTQESHVNDKQCTRHLSPYCTHHLRLSFGRTALTRNASPDNRQRFDTVRLDSLQRQFPCELALARPTELRTRDCLG